MSDDLSLALGRLRHAVRSRRLAEAQETLTATPPPDLPSEAQQKPCPWGDASGRDAKRSSELSEVPKTDLSALPLAETAKGLRAATANVAVAQAATGLLSKAASHGHTGPDLAQDPGDALMVRNSGEFTRPRPWWRARIFKIWPFARKEA